MRTKWNEFGLLREYPHRPSYDPDSFISEEHLSNYSVRRPTELPETAPSSVHSPPWPFRNMSIYLLMEWMVTGGNKKSVGEVDRLANEVLGSEQFKLGDLAGCSARQENARLDLSDKHDLDSPYAHDGWIESTIDPSSM